MPGGRRALRYSLRLPLEAYSTRTYSGPACNTEHRVTSRYHYYHYRVNNLLLCAATVCCVVSSPSCVHAPRRLIMFLCFPIIFIISISDTRSDKSLSVASSETKGEREKKKNLSICKERFSRRHRREHQFELIGVMRPDKPDKLFSLYRERERMRKMMLNP